MVSVLTNRRSGVIDLRQLSSPLLFVGPGHPLTNMPVVGPPEAAEFPLQGSTYAELGE